MEQSTWPKNVNCLQKEVHQFLHLQKAKSSLLKIGARLTSLTSLMFCIWGKVKLRPTLKLLKDNLLKMKLWKVRWPYKAPNLNEISCTVNVVKAIKHEQQFSHFIWLTIKIVLKSFVDENSLRRLLDGVIA